jgi:chromosomal replication initiation ATPase DnaA
MEKLITKAKKLSTQQKKVSKWLNIQKGWTINDLCVLFGVTIEQLESKSRKAEIVIARNFCFAYFYSLGNTLTPIAQAFNRDHATVIHGIKKIKNFIEIKDEETMNYLVELRINSPFNFKVSEEEWEELNYSL